MFTDTRALAHAHTQRWRNFPKNKKIFQTSRDGERSCFTDAPPRVGPATHYTDEGQAWQTNGNFYLPNLIPTTVVIMSGADSTSHLFPLPNVKGSLPGDSFAFVFPRSMHIDFLINKYTDNT